MKTMQETFDFVVNHLIKQGKQAREETWCDSCMYLDKDGNKCAVGCLIPDGHPAQKDINVTLGPLILKYTESGDNPLPKELYAYRYMLKTLQQLHDNSINWNDTGFVNIDAAREIAENFRLKWNF